MHNKLTPKHAFLFAVTALAFVLVMQIRLPEPSAVVWLPIQPQLNVLHYAHKDKGPAITAHAAILFENTTGTVLYGKNEHVRRSPASLTKIMTALLAFESGRMDDTVTISRRAAGLGGSSLYLKEGQQIPLRELMYGMLLRSGNDAAVAVAEHIAGSVSAFVGMMNQRADELGATNTRFANPHGLDAHNHYSTAFDLTMLSRTALWHKDFAEIVGTVDHTYEEKGITWRNTNRLLWSYTGAEGIKTGTTGQAGNCLAAAASREGMQLITVVLGSANRWRDTTTLLDYGFDNFDKVVVAEKGALLAQVSLPHGKQPLAIVPARDIEVIVSDQNSADISTQLHLAPIKLPIKKGAQIGTYEVYSGTATLASIPLRAANGVGRLTLWRMLTRWITKRK
ncbi:MAG TPA: D-alanyl-D-alanine carboxypeptidase [Firmicutes bacterium]|nr:D-alanyl-D-alanine carboxypeptidase [Bacillota bacterium]